MAFGLLSAATAAADISPRVPEDVQTALRRGEEVHVFVEVDAEIYPGSSTRQSLRDSVDRFARAQERAIASLPASLPVRYRYRYSPVFTVVVRSENDVDTLLRLPGVAEISSDLYGRGGLEASRAVIQADRVLESGWDGEGTVAAVIDSGVDSDDPDLAGAVVHAWHYRDRGEMVGEGAPDASGHGTAVSEIIASRGVDSEVGVAPGAEIVAIRVLNDDDGGWTSDWAMGIEHVVRLHEEDNGIDVDVINVSLLTFEEFDSYCDFRVRPLADACAAAREAGIVVFACAGNSGALHELAIPGCYRSTTSVSGVFTEAPDTFPTWANRGTHLDLVAPGEVEIREGDAIFRHLGCSFATPFASGIACALRQVDPGISPQAIDRLLKDTGVPVEDAANERFVPRVDAWNAMQSLLETDCDENGTVDYEEIDSLTDCDDDGRLDVCQIAENAAADCNTNGILDVCDIASDPGLDCDENGLIDSCEIAATPDLDCDGSGGLDICELDGNPILDCNWDGIPDSCELEADPSLDCDSSGAIDSCEIIAGLVDDLNDNGIPDSCEDGLVRFHRGDVNDDDRLAIDDPIFALNILFSDGGTVQCLDAADSNNDGGYNIADPVYTLLYLFADGPPPASPGPPGSPCGSDPEPPGSPGNLGCESYTSCG